MAAGATLGRADDLDPAVLERARAGDHAAFGQLVRAYDAGLRSLAHGVLGDAGRLDGVLQEAYLKAFRRLRAAGAGAGVRTWLYRITYQACLDELRRRSRPAPVDARPGLAAALAALPPDQRVAVLLVDAEGFDHAGAARVLGVGEGAVAARVAQARAALRSALRAGGGER